MSDQGKKRKRSDQKEGKEVKDFKELGIAFPSRQELAERSESSLAVVAKNFREACFKAADAGSWKWTHRFSSKQAENPHFHLLHKAVSESGVDLQEQRVSQSGELIWTVIWGSPF